ncbi:hypothetical protein [Asticcacaulis sp. 201]|uniref:hypothetical protein n=1 Tax=Asticcacaulis sp. 201 TaxID=3028787 RepID=UPI0029163B67|nr:hypothetical protein [Asticcacaulis sp. 201]MDV6330016.1 hypothetical protein [Asticcacaulis sp. 201]
MNRRQWIHAIAALALGARSARADGKRTSTLKPADPTTQRAFKPYYDIGGVLGFMVYDDASGDEADARAAIRDTLAQGGQVNDSALNALVPRRLSEAQFFGDWYNPSDGSLVWNGTVKTADGQELTRPKFTALADTNIASSGSGIPDIGQGGQFAYAFASPPYGLVGPHDKIQKVFDGVRDTLLPTGHVCVITDWTNPTLEEVSPYFKPGMEWWGVFLFTIYDATNRRLTVIIGSATD